MSEQINPLLLAAQLDNIRKQIILIQEQIKRIESTKITLNEIKNIKEKKEIIVNIGEGVYLRVNVLGNLDKVIYELGEGIFSEISIDEAINLLSKRQESLKKTLESLLKIEEDLRVKLEEAYKKIQSEQGKK